MLIHGDVDPKRCSSLYYSRCYPSNNVTAVAYILLMLMLQQPDQRWRRWRTISLLSSPPARATRYPPHSPVRGKPFTFFIII